MEDTLRFGEYMRMPHSKFRALKVETVGPLLTKQKTRLRTSVAPTKDLPSRYQILGNRRDVSVPFLPVSDCQEYCVSNWNGSMRRDLPSFGKTTLKNAQHRCKIARKCNFILLKVEYSK